MANIAIFGAGTVGSAFGRALLFYGHTVTFVDVNPARVAELKRSGFVATHPEQLILEGLGFLFVCVPTPSTEDGIDESYLQRATQTIGEKLRTIDEYVVVTYRSTMLPGTTARLTELLQTYSGKQAGADFGVCYYPEYLRAHAAYKDSVNPRLVLIGADEQDDKARRLVGELCVCFGTEVCFCTAEEAELQKYVHNLFNAIKISAFNEFRAIAVKLGIPPEQAIAWAAQTAEASYNPRYGTRDMGPYGGECLPKDMQAMRKHLQERGIASPLLDAVHQVNQSLKENK
jgi:UDPglucose 6-dehydrogenase